MTLNNVTVTGKIAGGTTASTVRFTPSAWLSDPGDSQLVPPAAVTVALSATGTFSVSLVATDNAVTPAGWYWRVEISGVPGVAYSAWSFFLPFANGATQDLSSLVAILPPSLLAAYMPLPSGTPAAGQVPVATGSGELSAWAGVSGTLLASHVYAPAVLATPTVSSATLAAFDSTNIQTGSFVAPASGSVIVEAAFQLAPPSTVVFAFALAEHGTVTPVANTVISGEVSNANVQPFTNLRWIVTGLTPGSTHNFDLLGAAATTSATIRALGSASTTPTGQTGGPVSLTVTAI